MNKLRTFIAVLCIAWGVLVISAYFVIHKPFTFTQFTAFLRLGQLVVGFVGTISLAMSFSRLLPPRLWDFPPIQRFPLQIGFGFAFLGFIMLLLGAFGGYRPWIAWIILLLGIPFGLPRISADIKTMISTLPKGKIDQGLMFFTLFSLGIILLLALAPPTAWDSLVYHLTGPKLYLQKQSLHHDIDIAYLGFPHAGSMIFTWAKLLVGPELAQVFHYLFAVLTLMLTSALAGEIIPDRKWAAVTILIGVPSAALLASWAYVEWFTMFAGLASFILMYKAGGIKFGGEQGEEYSPIDQRTSSFNLILAGFFTAFALNAKYTSIGMVIGLCLLVLLLLRSARGLTVFGLAVVLFVSPYVLKNYLLTGNPVYPFFLPGIFWDEFRAFWYSRGGTGLNLSQLLIAPWEATIYGVEGAAVINRPPYSATIGPLLLVLIPFSILRLFSKPSNSRRVVSGMVLVTFVTYLFWIAGLAYSELLVQTRLLFPVLPLLVILALLGFESLGTLGKWGLSARFILGGLIGFILIVFGVELCVQFVRTSPLGVITGIESQGDYLEERLGPYAQIMDEVNQLPDQSKVIFLWEPRSYYCSGEIICEPDVLLDRWWHLRRLGNRAESIVELWRGDKVSHILLYHFGANAIREAGFDPLTTEDWDELKKLEQDYLVPLNETSIYGLYRLADE
jgi:hypothetical protein